MALVGELLFSDSIVRWVLWAFAFGLGIGGVFLARYILNNLIERSAPFLLSPHGVSDPGQAQEQLRDYLDNDALPRILVHEGTASQETVLPVMGFERQRGRLEVDRVSAVLLWKSGGYILRHEGSFPYSIDQRIVGILDLRPQSVPFDDNYWTVDAMRVQVKGKISYRIIQDENYFREHQSHLTSMEIAQRALLSESEWRHKTGNLLLAKVRDVILQIAFSDFFVTPNHLRGLDLYETIKQFYTQAPLKNVSEEIRKRVIGETRERLAEWGVEIIKVTIEAITPPKEFAESAKRLHEGWLRQLDQEREEQHSTRVELEHANRQFDLAQLQQKIKVTDAETDKQIKQLNAEGDAAEHETRMKARAMGALEFARRIETLRQAMGNTLDEGTFRELLRALDLLREDDKEELQREAMARLYNAQRSMRMDE